MAFHVPDVFPTRFRFVVSSRSGVKTAAKRLGATHLLSLVDRGVRTFCPPRVGRPNHLELYFEDEENVAHPSAPRRDQVETFLAWGRRLPDGASLVVNCEAGRCRSSAAAFLLAVQDLGLDRAQEALDLVLALRPLARPNLLVVRYGDELLDAGGALTALAEARARAVDPTSRPN